MGRVRSLAHGWWELARLARAVPRFRLIVGALTAGACLWPMAGLAQAAPPSNVTLPVIQGTPQQGQSLTYVSGTWNDTVVTVTDQWWECNLACAPIPGTTPNQLSYTLQATDVGATIKIHETATNSGGEISPPVDSAPFGPVTPLPPANTFPPVISGTAPVEQTVAVAYPGSWTNTPTAYHYLWKDCSVTCVASPTSADVSVQGGLVRMGRREWAGSGGRVGRR